MAAALQFNLLGLDCQELTAIVEKLGAPSYRARQLVQAIYVERRQALDQVSTLPRTFRQALADTGYEVRFPAVDRKFTSTDGTIRYLISFADGQSVETVWMPEGDGGNEGEEEPSRPSFVVRRRLGSSD